MNDFITLISETFETDEYGNHIVSNTNQKNIFAKIQSISQSEYYAAAQTDLKPEYKITVWVFDYSGEKKALINKKEYEIFRTYTVGDYIELYLKAVE